MIPYFSADGVELHLGDCREVLSGLGRVEHVITDPPYEAEAHTLQRREKVGPTQQNGRGRSDDRRSAGIVALDFGAITESERAEVGAAIAAVVQRWAIVFCQVEAAMKWRSALEPLSYRRTCVWVKPDGQPQLSGDRPGMGYESIVACHKQGRSHWNGGGRTGVFVHNKGVSGTPNEHPTQKPLALMQELIQLFTDAGETILDPFAGSGSTLIAAWRLGRKSIGVELSEKYAEIAAKRIEREQKQGRLFHPKAEQGDLLAGVAAAGEASQ